MIARILVVEDMHKKYKEPSSIKGLLRVQRLIQEEIIDYVQRNEITHVIIAGDWYDRGYHGLGPAFGAIELDRRLSDAVNGNVYLCIGNHFFLERDENPEMYIIQPNPYIKPKDNIPLPEKPIFKLVPRLRLGDVQISFFHFNKVDKEYIAEREEGVRYHIGIYHDNSCLPNHISEAEGFAGTATQSYMNRIYANIDLAIHGHIHHKVGLFGYDLATKRIPMIVPGSMCCVANQDKYKHPEVELPVITINDDSVVNLSLVPFSTHVAELRFQSSEKKKKKKTQVDSILNNEVHMTTSSAALRSLPTYLYERGYSQASVKLVDAAMKGHLDLGECIRIITEVNVDGGDS